MVAHKVPMTSTLAVFELFVPNRPPLEPRVLEAMAPDVRAEYLTSRARLGETGAFAISPDVFRKAQQFELEFVRAGRLLAAGVDPTGNGGALPGFGDQRNYELLIEAGFTPVEAIRIMTLNGATMLGEEKRLGSVTAGKLADLVVIKGDPVATAGRDPQRDHRLQGRGGLRPGQAGRGVPGTGGHPMNAAFRTGDRTLCRASSWRWAWRQAGGSWATAFSRGRTATRYVEVKGLAEREVAADLALWPLRFVTTGDDLAVAQTEITRDTREVYAFPDPPRHRHRRQYSCWLWRCRTPRPTGSRVSGAEPGSSSSRPSWSGRTSRRWCWRPVSGSAIWSRRVSSCLPAASMVSAGLRSCSPS